LAKGTSKSLLLANWLQVLVNVSLEKFCCGKEAGDYVKEK
jgi:hypothetical protein